MEVSTGPVNVKNKVQIDVGSLCNPGKRCFIISEEEIHFSADLLKIQLGSKSVKTERQRRS